MRNFAEAGRAGNECSLSNPIPKLHDCLLSANQVPNPSRQKYTGDKVTTELTA
jgi:hypothetical protein